MTPASPQTAEGRELLRWLAQKGYPTDPARGFVIGAERTAKAQARAAFAAELREAVEALPFIVLDEPEFVDRGWDVPVVWRAAVLQAIDERAADALGEVLG